MRDFTVKALATREKILRAANDLFYLHGYNATGIDRIIAEAGVAKGNFFHHFRNKEALATAVLDWHRELAFAEMGLSDLLRQKSPRKTLMQLLRAMTGRMRAGKSCPVRGCLFGNFALELSAGCPPVQAKLKEIFTGLRGLIQSLLEKAQAAGEISANLDSDTMAGLILSLIEGAVLVDKANQTVKEVKAAVQMVDGLLK